MKKILLFTTGGTIASKEGNNGLEPEMDANELLSYMGDLANQYDITCRELLSLDSSNIQAEEWRKIARNIFENLEQYDGIVVTHGTDTMAYTASMLSFMLQNLKVPVVLTGSQMPIDNMLTDARNNLYAAFAAIDAGDVYKRQSQSDSPRHLVKRLAGGIVPRPSDYLKLPVILHDHQVGMSPRYNQAHKRRL